MRILIIEDDEYLGLTLKQSLESESFKVDLIQNGINYFQLIKNQIYDLLILDYILPFKNGFIITKELRARKIQTPILIISSTSNIDDKVNFLEHGADDYLVKPFAHRELVARTKSLIRRHYRNFDDKQIFKINNLHIDFNKFEVYKGNLKVNLTKKEFGILEYLINRNGQIVSQKEIFERVWGEYMKPNSNTVSVHISSLRKKIECSENKIIQTLIGRGFRI